MIIFVVIVIIHSPDMVILIVDFHEYHSQPINWKSREIKKALAPLMACVSKPMRMNDFLFQLADTLFQYSSLKHLSKRCLWMHLPPHPRNKTKKNPTTTCTGFDFHGPFSFKDSFFFSDALGLQQQQKNSLHVFATQSRRLRESGRVEERVTQSQEIEDGM